MLEQILMALCFVFTSFVAFITAAKSKTVYLQNGW